MHEAAFAWAFLSNCHFQLFGMGPLYAIFNIYASTFAHGDGGIS